MKRTLFILILTLGICCINVNAQTKKRVPVKKTNVQAKPQSKYEENLLVYKDGFAFVKLSNKELNLEGVKSITGKEIVPFKYKRVEYEQVGHFFYVRDKDDCVGIYTCDGKCIISTDKKYSSVYLESEGDRICWYIKKDGKKGMLDAMGAVVIPPKYEMVCFTRFYDDYKHNRSGPFYFVVQNNENWECYYDLNGKRFDIGDYIIFCENGKILTYERGQDGELYKKEIDYSEYSMFNYEKHSDLMYCESNHNYDITLSTNFLGDYRYHIMKSNNKLGFIDSHGKIIVPCEMDALESAGTGYLKYKLNGFWGVMNYTGKVIIDTNRGYTSIGDFKTFNKRFAYTMDGYKGECNQLGQQVSKIRVTKPKPVSTAASSSTSRLTDCTAFDLKGKVKSCTVSAIGDGSVLSFLAGDMSSMLGTTVGEYSFTQNGKYIPNKGEKVIYEGNVLKKIIKGSNGTEYVYKNGRLHRKNENGELFGMTYMTIHEYTYDERGMIIIEKEGELSATGSEDIVRYYSDYELDSHGNWTSRKCKINDRVVKGEIRHITYY